MSICSKPYFISEGMTFLIVMGLILTDCLITYTEYITAVPLPRSPGRLYLGHSKHTTKGHILPIYRCMNIL